MRTPRAARGLTLVESAIALAVAAITVTAAVPSLGAFVEARRLDGIAAQLGLDLREARAEALRRQVGVHVDVQRAPWGTCYVVHTGPAGACRCAADGPAACSGGARPLRTVQLPGDERIAVQSNVAAIRFDPLHGTATPTGTLKVVAASGRAVHQVVNVMGRVRGCTSPEVAAAVPGYRPC
jgi:type IV fimbrial biogenesis protein FimT